jgi:hypothetical protein
MRRQSVSSASPTRGDVFAGAALTILLIAVTLAVLLGLSRLPTRVARA